MTMPEVVTCPQCRKTVQIPQHLLGTSVKCPACRGRFTAALGIPRRSGDPGRSGDKAPWWIFALVGGGLAVLLLLLLCGGVGLMAWRVGNGIREGVEEAANALRRPESVDEALTVLKSGDQWRGQLALDYLREAPVEEGRRAEVAQAVTPLVTRSDFW